MIVDVTREIKHFKNGEFDYIIFDFGNKKSFGDGFSLENYKEAYRVLRNNGKLYNYIPKHQVRRGRNFSSEVITRIKQVGFRNIEKNKEGSYIIARK
jgi:predicted methyltransferase